MCVHVNIHPPMSLTNIPAYVLNIHVKFNHYKKTCSSGVKGRVGSNSIYVEKSKVGGELWQKVNNSSYHMPFKHIYLNLHCTETSQKISKYMELYFQGSK